MTARDTLKLQQYGNVYEVEPSNLCRSHINDYKIKP